MDRLAGKSALVVGASSGVGRAVLLALAARGVRVSGVARGRERLERLAREAPGSVSAVCADATEPGVLAGLLREGPDLVVLCAGVRPRLAPLEEQTWASFSAPWNEDVKVSFLLGQEALRRPLKPGSRVVMLSSGAAIGGSPLSGGYAGAKRMQWLLAGYLQKRSDALQLGIQFRAVVPKQLIVGTEIAELASSAYAADSGISVEKYMERFGSPLVPEGVASAILTLLEGEGPAGSAVAVTGKGIEAL